MPVRRKTTSEAASLSAAKGRRYSAEDRREVLAFVYEVDAARGRGGITAAAQKFGITSLTISSWKTKDGVLPPATLGSEDTVNQIETLKRMLQLAEEIGQLEKRISALRENFKRLRRSF
jgi:transposase-like protein